MPVIGEPPGRQRHAGDDGRRAEQPLDHCRVKLATISTARSVIQLMVAAGSVKSLARIAKTTGSPSRVLTVSRERTHVRYRSRLDPRVALGPRPLHAVRHRTVFAGDGQGGREGVAVLRVGVQPLENRDNQVGAHIVVARQPRSVQHDERPLVELPVAQRFQHGCSSRLRRADTLCPEPRRLEQRFSVEVLADFHHHGADVPQRL